MYQPVDNVTQKQKYTYLNNDNVRCTRGTVRGGRSSIVCTTLLHTPLPFEPDLLAVETRRKKVKDKDLVQQTV